MQYTVLMHGRHRMWAAGVVVLLALFPAALSAHQTGASFETTVGQYLVDVGYDPIAPESGDRLVLDFDIKKADKTRVPYDYVWVRLLHGDNSILATGVARADIGPTTILYQLPQDFQGPMTIETRFQRGDDTLAESSSQLPIARGRGTLFSGWLVPGAVGLIGAGLGALAALYLREKGLI